MSFYKRKGRKKVNDKKKPRKFFQLSGFLLLYCSNVSPKITAKCLFHHQHATH